MIREPHAEERPDATVGPVTIVTEVSYQSAPRGLSGAEARARLERFGPNALPEEPPETFWHRFAAQFRSPLIYILLFALGVDIASCQGYLAYCATWDC